MRTSSKVAFLSATAALLVAGVHAGTLSIAVDTVRFIVGPVRGMQVGRFVFRVSVPQEVERSRVDFVRLELPAIQLGDTGSIVTLESFQATTPWDARSVTWTYPWQRPGGDYGAVGLSRFTTAAGDSHPIVLDITGCVRDWQERGFNFGVFLKRPDCEGGGFGPESLQVRQSLGSARIRFYFTRIQR